MKFIARADLEAFGERFFTAKGVSAETAKPIIQAIVDTEAFGVKTHGVAMFAFLNGQVGKEIDPKAQPTLVKDHGATAVIDGGSAFGQLAMEMAKDLARKKAREFGVAMIAARKTFWVGAVVPYVLPLAREGFLVQAWAQSSTCKDCAPFGGLDPTFSTNPVCVAFPTGDDPALADFSTASSSVGGMNTLIRKGKKAPEKIFRDKDGKLTDDPNAFKEGGSILFMGGEHQGYKGYALSLWCEALTAMAGGDANNPEAPSRQSVNLLVADPAAFAGQDAYVTEMKRFVQRVKSVRTLPGVDAIRLPGERGSQAMRTAAKEGIPLEPFMLDKLNDIAKENNFSGL